MTPRQDVSTGSPYEPIVGGDVIRTRILLTRIEDWQAVARVHGEVFRDIRPVNTIMQVARFIDPEWLIETEVDAVLSEP